MEHHIEHVAMENGEERSQSANVRENCNNKNNYHTKLFIAKFKCPQLKDPHYGIVNITGYYPHKKAIYSCHYGYKLVGSPYRKCAYGKWGGDEPVCKRK